MKKQGFTLIDVLVGVALFSLIFIGIFGAYQLTFYVIGTSQNKIIATYIANGEIEKVKNLKYEDIGVQGSFPNGVLVSQEQVVKNNITFLIKRRVDFVVDSSDGIAPPDDDCPNDYKRFSIEVSSQGKFKTTVKMVSDIMPKNLAQECAEGGGILSVMVFNALGEPVFSPLIEVKNPTTGEVIKSASPMQGTHYFSLAPNEYQIVVSKNGYSSERTYGIQEIASPISPNPIVIEGGLVQKSFAIDLFGSMHIETLSKVGDDFFPISNVTFNLRGSKTLGKDQQERFVYKYSQDHTSNSEGVVDIQNLEWDNYYFSIVSPQNLQLIGLESSTGETIEQPVSLNPQQNYSVKLLLGSENTLLVNVLNSQTSEPIFSAQVRLKNDLIGYDVLKYSNQQGEVYFIPLEPGSYTLEVEAPGYNSWSSQILISGQKNQTVNLQQIE